MNIRFTHKRQETDDIWSFFFEPTEPLAWIAGQSIRIELPRATWGSDERRFTIASAPSEKHLRVTTRLSGSSFKRSLQSLEPGATVQAFAVEGKFIWHDTPPGKLFLAGGIGITPFRSMLIQLGHTQLPADVALIHISKEQPSLFREEFDSLHISGKFMSYFQNKRLDMPTLQNYCPDWKERTVYLSGPEEMIYSLQKELLSHGLPEARLLTDIFSGII